VTQAVSAVSAIPAVREILVRFQRSIINIHRRIVVEGRDIGSVVAPAAHLKVFLTASSAERARRRSAEIDADVAATEADLARRDRIDSTRTVDPLRLADGAIELDSTALGIDEVVARLHHMLKGKGRA
jgi:cytidylate kinase